MVLKTWTAHSNFGAAGARSLPKTGRASQQEPSFPLRDRPALSSDEMRPLASVQKSSSFAPSLAVATVTMVFLLVSIGGGLRYRSHRDSACRCRNRSAGRNGHGIGGGYGSRVAGPAARAQSDRSQRDQHPCEMTRDGRDSIHRSTPERGKTGSLWRTVSIRGLRCPSAARDPFDSAGDRDRHPIDSKSFPADAHPCLIQNTHGRPDGSNRPAESETCI